MTTQHPLDRTLNAALNVTITSLAGSSKVEMILKVTNVAGVGRKWMTLKQKWLKRTAVRAMKTKH